MPVLGSGVSLNLMNNQCILVIDHRALCNWQLILYHRFLFFALHLPLSNFYLWLTVKEIMICMRNKYEECIYFWFKMFFKKTFRFVGCIFRFVIYVNCVSCGFGVQIHENTQAIRIVPDRQFSILILQSASTLK